MLILPLSHKPTLKTFPFVTAALLAVNVFVFVALQLPDDRRYYEFVEEYVQSGLAQIEVPLYAKWRATHGKEASAPRHGGLDDAQYLAESGIKIQHDREFLLDLPGLAEKSLPEARFAHWRAERSKVDAIWQRVFTERYIFVPGIARPITYFTHMFMHGGFGHLFGNMVVLVLIGLMVEAAVGGFATAGLYLAGGLGAVILYSATVHDRMAGMLGASGAIAALMGACAVLYGLRKVRFFYHVVFYFDFVSLPAIAVLPLWVANELWQWANYRQFSNVAYFAHVGGLLSGALLALPFRQSVAARLKSAGVPSVEKEEDIARLKERAYAALRNMQLETAGRDFEQLLRRDPGNAEFARQLYTVSRSAPASERYHRSARYLMQLAAKTGELALLGQTVEGYWKSALPAPRLEAEQIARYAKLLAKQGVLTTAAMLADAVMKLPPAKAQGVDLADVALALFAGCRRAETEAERGRGKQYFQILESRFPGSEQLKLARQLGPA